MKHAKIVRVTENDYGTYGVMVLNDRPLCVTLERKWEGNKPFESCIPRGVYACRRVESLNFGETFEICDVPGRSNILFHVGNSYLDTSGCVLLGSMYGAARIYNSALAVKRFLDRMGDTDEFLLDVITTY